MAEVSANCLNCAIGKIFTFTAIMGLSTTIYDCKNDNNREVARTRSALFYLKKFCAVLSLLIIFVSNYYAIKRAHKAIKNNISLFDLLLTSSDVILYMVGSIIIMHCISQHERTNNMFIFFDKILKNFATCTSRHLLSKDDVVHFRMRTYVILILTLLVNSGIAVCLFCTELDPVWNSIERLGLFLCIYACLMMIIIALMFLKLAFYANNKYKRFLKMELENIINGWSSTAYENQNCSVAMMPRRNVTKLLKDYSDTFIGFNKIFKAFNKSCNPIILILILFIIFFCVISMFLVIVYVEMNTSITIRFLSTQFGMQCIICSTGYCIIRFSVINTLNQQELTLLRKFPSSRLLNSSENFQFDCFLYVVERYQTKMEASEITSVDIPLFASILSTILTYVLVAVQFQFL